MRQFFAQSATAVVALGLVLSLSSCGESNATPPDATAAAAGPSTATEAATGSGKPTPFVPPAVSISNDLTPLDQDVAAADPDEAEPARDELDDEVVPEQAEPVKGSPEWMVREIALLSSAPLDYVRQPVPGKPGEFTQIDLTDEQIDKERARRAAQIIDWALEVCAKTRDDSTRQQLFNNAVHYLAMSRSTLALAGDRAQVRLLSDESEALFKRDAKSFAAIDSHLKLVELLQGLADQEGRANPEWAQAAAKHARLFVSRFPQEAPRAALTVLSAARACESAGLFADAQQCYARFETEFSKTPFADQAAGALRRYKLTGRPLAEFAGSTIDGGYVSIDQLRGQPVLIVFWSTGSRGFQQDLPQLRKIVDAAGDKLTVLGVNFDSEEAIVDSFLEQANLPWKTIFFSNPEQRGLRSPLARFYGVTTVPQYWVVDAKGVVTAAPTDINGAAKELQRLGTAR